MESYGKNLNICHCHMMSIQARIFENGGARWLLSASQTCIFRHTSKVVNDHCRCTSYSEETDIPQINQSQNKREGFGMSPGHPFTHFCAVKNFSIEKRT